MAAPTYYSGAVVKIDGNVGSGHYKVHQEPIHHFFPTGRHGRRSGNRIEIDFSFSIISISGYIDLDEGKLVLSVSVVGIPLGTFQGSLKTGIVIDVTLLVVTGYLKLYVKDDGLYLDIGLKPIWGGEIKETVRIIQW